MSESETKIVIKICPVCSRDSATTSFEKYAFRKPKSMTRKCDDCFRAAARERMKGKYAETNERARAYYHERKKSHPEKIKASAFKCKLKNFYGLTVEAYDSMVKSQDNKCAICGRGPDQVSDRLRKLHIDHCHSTGRVRALLCGPCNSAIGQFREDVSVLQKAIDYLNRHGR